ncbi:hypothetical protein [Psychromicrobium lacuslunae]|uniref:Acetone carboxylase n=1 Tax=Psychromicrobium lacuslunae TaxID=1618207 RepID=A0A0D4BXN0_9MICC|nr:hypothetical protein [Psychromicrobium lacuslunae]AJT40890.1 hypothetical protein UM93_04045 [Psychromicrobium lacuslunae]
MSFLDSLSGSAAPEKPQCSRKACRAEARWQLQWNNPAVHSPERLKVWLACDQHREWLEDYLRVRGFFRQTVPFTPGPGEV